MSIGSQDITDVIKSRLKDFKAELVTSEVGRIITVGDGIAQIYGLRGAMAGELLQFPGDVYGMALNLEEDQVRAVIMGPYEHLKEGDVVKTTGRIVEVPVDLDSDRRVGKSKMPIFKTIVAYLRMLARQRRAGADAVLREAM